MAFTMGKHRAIARMGRDPRTLGALLLAASLAQSCGREPAGRQGVANLLGAAQGWNVVLITVDTLRADRLGAYGYAAHPNSPVIDHLLSGGAVLDNAMAQRAATWPSLATLLTGLYPRSHGVVENGYLLPPELPTLPKLFQSAGYQTGAFLSNMCRAGHAGWDAFNCSGGSDGRLLRRASEWLGSLPGKAPFFAWVHFFGPHPPYYSGGDLSRSLDPGYNGPLAPRRQDLDRIMTQGIELGPSDLRHLDAIYDAAVMGTDRQVGRLLEALHATGRLDRTVIVFTADHGEELYEHNRYLYHSCSVYQSTLHVPLGIIAPGLIPAGLRVRSAVELVDVAPTLLALAGIPAPAAWQGTSLTRYLGRSGTGGESKPAFSEDVVNGIHTVLAEGWKLVDNPAGVTPQCMPGAPTDFYKIANSELYFLPEDPGERHNRAAAEGERVASLRALIQQRFNGLPNRSRPQDVPEEVKQKLRALGYLAN